MPGVEADAVGLATGPAIGEAIGRPLALPLPLVLVLALARGEMMPPALALEGGAAAVVTDADAEPEAALRVLGRRAGLTAERGSGMAGREGGATSSASASASVSASASAFGSAFSRCGGRCSVGRGSDCACR